MNLITASKTPFAGMKDEGIMERISETIANTPATFAATGQCATA